MFWETILVSISISISISNHRWVLAEVSAKHDAPLSGGGGGNSESGDLSTATVMAEALRRSSGSSPFSSRCVHIYARQNITYASKKWEYTVVYSEWLCGVVF